MLCLTYVWHNKKWYIRALCQGEPCTALIAEMSRVLTSNTNKNHHSMQKPINTENRNRFGQCFSTFDKHTIYEAVTKNERNTKSRKYCGEWFLYCYETFALYYTESSWEDTKNTNSFIHRLFLMSLLYLSE